MISTKNTARSTSRVWVPKNGHEGVVKILLEKDDNNLNEPHDGSQTPLGWDVR